MHQKKEIRNKQWQNQHHIWNHKCTKNHNRGTAQNHKQKKLQVGPNQSQPYETPPHPWRSPKSQKHTISPHRGPIPLLWHITVKHCYTHNHKDCDETKPKGSMTTIWRQNTRKPQTGQTLIVVHQPSETHWGGSHHLVWGSTHRHAIKEGRYRMYSDRRAWANSVDRWDATECGIWSGSTLFATHPTIFTDNIR